MVDVSILIPHYNNPKILAPCLESLCGLEQGTPTHTVTVIDDGSTDNSVEWIHENHPEVEAIERSENGGFIAAISEGVHNTAGEILVFLNNDTRVEAEWLTRLVDPLLSGKVAGATGSILMDWEGERALFKGGSLNYLGFGFEDRGELPNSDGDLVPLLFVCGGAMAIPRRLYFDTGGFDESYVSLYEDLDLGWRLNLLGYGCFLAPGSRVAHRGHASYGKQSFERKASHYIGNSLRTVFKNWDGRDHLERMELVVTLAQARERVCLMGEDLRKGFWQRFGSWLGGQASSGPIVDSLVREEERTRSLATKRKWIQERRKTSSSELFQRFVPNPTRGWFYDEEQNRLLEEKGYWELERRMYAKYGPL